MTRRGRSNNHVAHRGPSASVRSTVPFHDVDAMRIVWHGNYLKYFELARDALFSARGVDLYGFADGAGIVFPVIRTATRHSHPLCFGDAFECRATVVEARIKLVIEYELELEESGVVCATGSTEQVALSVPDHELQLRLPESLCRALGFSS